MSVILVIACFSIVSMFLALPLIGVSGFSGALSLDLRSLDSPLRLLSKP